MVRLSELHPEEAQHMLGRAALLQRSGFDFDATPWITPKPLRESKIALISTAALHRRDDPAFRFGDTGYRLIPDDVDPADLVQSHISVNFDRTHYQRDLNVVLPIDRLHELADAGEIGGVSPAAFLHPRSDRVVPLRADRRRDRQAPARSRSRRSHAGPRLTGLHGRRRRALAFPPTTTASPPPASA